jgi:hypothetical protein
MFLYLNISKTSSRAFLVCTVGEAIQNEGSDSFLVAGFSTLFGTAIEGDGLIAIGVKGSKRGGCWRGGRFPGANTGVGSLEGVRIFFSELFGTANVLENT